MTDATGLFAVSLDAFTSIGFWTGVGIIAGTYTIFSLGLQLNVGFTGIFNFGQAGFMAVGAYSMAILVTDTGIDFWLSLPLAILITMAFGLIVALPAVRLRTDYLAIATIAAAEAVRLFALNATELTGGAQGLFGFDDSWDEVSETIEGWLEALGWSNPENLFPLFLVVWVVALILTFVMAKLQKSPWGRVMRAVREDEDAARALGKNAFAYKLQSLVIAAALRRDRRVLPRAQPALRHPRRVLTHLHVPRLRRARPRRARQLLGRRDRIDHLLDDPRGPALHRPADIRGQDLRAPLHPRRPRPDPADGLPPAGDVREEGGDGAR